MKKQLMKLLRAGKEHEALSMIADAFFLESEHPGNRPALDVLGMEGPTRSHDLNCISRGIYLLRDRHSDETGEKL